MHIPGTLTVDARNISVPRALVACVAVTVLLGTIITPAARAQELDGQMDGVVVNATGDQLPQPTPRSVTIPSGTMLEVLLGQQLSTRTDRVGDTFSIRLARSMVIDNETVLAEGTPLLGQIVDFTPAWQKASRLTLVLHRLVLKEAGVAIPIQSEPLTLERKRSVKDYAIGGSICAASFAAAVIIGHRRQHAGGEGPEGYLAIGGCALGGVAYEHVRTKDLVLAPKKKLVFRLIGDVTVSLPVK